MTHNRAYFSAEKKIEKAWQLKYTDLHLHKMGLTELPVSIGALTHLKSLDLSGNRIENFPDALEHLTSLQSLHLSANKLTTIPEQIRKLTKLQKLYISFNKLLNLPNWIDELVYLRVLDASFNRLTTIPMLEKLARLETLNLGNNRLTILPDSIFDLKNLRALSLSNNELVDIPSFISQLEFLEQLNLDGNPLNSELNQVNKQGHDAIKTYLHAKEEAQITINEAKLIIVGEGAVGKTCLTDALHNNEWQVHPTTHGIEIKQVKLMKKMRGWKRNKKEITLNAWDFGGQRVYRPTHQLFFSAPAVYLVVWKPREGPQQGFVKEWIHLIKRREPSAKILVVATHGGPQQRQPDIDRQDLWDMFGRGTIIDFFLVDSKPDENGNRKGIEELKSAIARVAAQLPEVGRSVPKSFASVRNALQEKNVPYLSLNEVLKICTENKMDDELSSVFITISHRLGHLTHYANDPILKDIVILRPDWLATAMSYILDDEEIRSKNGLVGFSRLSQLWNDISRPPESRYPENLHRIFLKLMERFDLSYRVKGISPDEEENPVSLIAQLVPDNTPEENIFQKSWSKEIEAGDIQQAQICRIVDAQTGQSANAEGLFYQLIVRLHKYSLGREHYHNSVHWQRGLILDADYNGRALLRHIGNDVHIIVRAPYPERFLAMLTEEVKYLVESFWEGLRCDITVPCLNPKPCLGLMEVQKLIESKQKKRDEYPCPICNEWQSIDKLLLNAPAASQPISIEILEKQLSSIENKLDTVDVNVRRFRSQTDKNFDDLFRIFTDEAKEGPRLFSFFPVAGNKFNPQTWVREKFRLVLWCEHSKLPLPVLNDGNMQKGVYDLEFEREWFQKAVPYLKFLTGTLSLVLPVASSTLSIINSTAFKDMENKLSLGKDVIDAITGTGTAFNEIMGKTDSTSLEHGVGIRAENSTLRELHAMLKVKDPGFGGLVRVMNKRQEFLWVHKKYASEY